MAPETAPLPAELEKAIQAVEAPYRSREGDLLRAAIHRALDEREREVEALRNVRRQAEVFAKVGDAHFAAMSRVLQYMMDGAKSGVEISLQHVSDLLPADQDQPSREVRILQRLCEEADKCRALLPQDGRGGKT